MKLKKILALAGVAILALLYVITLISALFTSPATPQLFKACVLATFIVPIFLYGYLLIYRLMKERADAAKKEIDEQIRQGAVSDKSPEANITPESDKNPAANVSPKADKSPAAENPLSNEPPVSP